MPTYHRFEELPAWQAAVELAEGCEDLLISAGGRISRGKQDQLDRASLSVSNKIAEGFERGTTAELLQFLYIARGSAGEVRSMLLFFARRPALAEFRPRLTALICLAESCSRQIRAWADSLRNSDIAGPRRLNDQTRAAYQRRKAQEQGQQKFIGMQRPHIAKLPKTHRLRIEFARKHGPIPDPE